MTKRIAWCAIAALLCVSAPAGAQSPQQLAGDATRYMALGDSIAAGFKAQPMTQGYAFLLYQRGVFDRVPHTLFNDIAAVGATSYDVLTYQVPQALIPGLLGGFQAQYLTLTVGGNDLAGILTCIAQNTPPPTCIAQALGAYTTNLTTLLAELTTGLPNAKIFVSNQYSVPEIQASLPGDGAAVLALFNAATADAVALFDHVYFVDVHSAFLGRNGLLLIERRGAGPLEVHLTNAGHAAMANAFADVIEANK